MTTSRLQKLLLFFLVAMNIATTISLIVSHPNFIIIIIYILILYFGYRNLLSTKSSYIGMYLLAITSFLLIAPILNLFYLGGYLYLLNLTWPNQQKELFKKDNTQILYQFEPVLIFPGRPKKFWQKIYIVQKDNSIVGYVFKGARIIDSFELFKLCCPRSVKQTTLEKIFQVQRITANTSEHDEKNVMFEIPQEKMGDVIFELDELIDTAIQLKKTNRFINSQ